MGLFSSIFSSPKTKAEWDSKIMSLNDELTRAKVHLQEAKFNAKRYSTPGNLHHANDVKSTQQKIERLKGEIANAKIQRKNAPK